MTAVPLLLGPVESVVALVETGACVAGDALGVRALCYGFMARALLAGVCVAVVGPLVGSFLVHRELAFIGDTLAHAAFAGVAVGLFLGSALGLGVSPLLAALMVTVLVALAVQVVVERTGQRGDVTMAVVLSGSFALGTVLVSLTDGGIAVSISAYLFGSLTTVSREHAALLLVLTGGVGATVAATYRQLLLVTVDARAARVAGVAVRRYERLLVVLTAAVVVAAMQILGVILVAAMLVVPVATVTPGAPSFRASVLRSVVAGQVAVLLGLAAAYQYGVAAGGAVILVAVALYVAVPVVRWLRAGLPGPTGASPASGRVED